ncbi:MAG: hypothetical protein Q9163_000203 [Psora crenata]
MNELEQQRQANIKRNRDHLKKLGILYQPPASVAQVAVKPAANKRRKPNTVLPSRSSARIASAPVKLSYNENGTGTKAATREKADRKAVSTGVKANVEIPDVAAVTVRDLESLRVSWTSWKSTSPPPIRDEESVFHFEDHPDFIPNKSPEELLREGCFGGSYFRCLYSHRLGITIKEDYKELPQAWYEGLDIETFLTSPQCNPEANKYKVKCGQSIEEWEAAGWINHDYDVRGWFQWYCRFFMGRRCEDDKRQIGRWRRCVSSTGRWRRALLRKYVSMGVKEVFDHGENEEKGDVSPAMHQTCFQWAYEYLLLCTPYFTSSLLMPY